MCAATNRLIGAGCLSARMCKNKRARLMMSNDERLPARLTAAAVLVFQNVAAGYTLRAAPLSVVAAVEVVAGLLEARVNTAITLLSYKQASQIGKSNWKCSNQSKPDSINCRPTGYSRRA